MDGDGPITITLMSCLISLSDTNIKDVVDISEREFSESARCQTYNRTKLSLHVVATK